LPTSLNRGSGFAALRQLLLLLLLLLVAMLGG